MKGKRLFLKWALFACLIVIGAIIAASLGWAGYLRRDPTHITYVTLIVFIAATLRCGRLNWRLSGEYDPADVKTGLKRSWFSADLCMYIGLIGTAIGYYLMLEHGADGEASTVIKMAFANTSIAIVNTVVGAICGVLLQIQAHGVETAYEMLHPEAVPEKKVSP